MACITRCRGAEGMGTPVRLPVFPEDRRQRARSGPSLQRILADDFLAAVFPCIENVASRREILDHHPLVQQTLRDCLSEAMDIEGLERLLAEIARGETRVIARPDRALAPYIERNRNVSPSDATVPVAKPC